MNCNATNPAREIHSPSGMTVNIKGERLFMNKTKLLIASYDLITFTLYFPSKSSILKSSRICVKKQLFFSIDFAYLT